MQLIETNNPTSFSSKNNFLRAYVLEGLSPLECLALDSVCNKEPIIGLIGTLTLMGATQPDDLLYLLRKIEGNGSTQLPSILALHMYRRDFLPLNPSAYGVEDRYPETDINIDLNYAMDGVTKLIPLLKQLYPRLQVDSNCDTYLLSESTMGKSTITRGLKT